MATRSAPTIDAAAQAQAWLAAYHAQAPREDVLSGPIDPAWAAMFAELAAIASADLGHARERVQRHAGGIGAGFRAGGAARPWALSPIPLLISAHEWAGIAAGVRQRAALLEAVLADLYGEQSLIAEGRLPAAVMAGSSQFLRQLVGLRPPGGRHLQCVAVDLARGPDGAWRVLADHLRAPVGLGRALENRLAVSGTLGGPGEAPHVQRHAPFFAQLRAGLAALCRRAEPRLALLTPGRSSPSHAEQAHLARYLGLLLVEGADLAALDRKLYIRTIGGLKRIDGLWSWTDPRLLDPLAFDNHSAIGVPALADAWAAGELVLANAPGAGVLEARVFAAFLPALAEPLTGAPLLLPNRATWWCGQ
ncbi:MAG: circularly permuted type 2 ATP-grasp protein, partial [Acetobacteraceae bacterium]|nr:circularly permuted type 2 ATP-grasp protein [Acetobacteraceae bacterium]